MINEETTMFKSTQPNAHLQCAGAKSKNGSSPSGSTTGRPVTNSRPPNGPSTTGNPSGSGRGNNPPKVK
ncbi:TPA: hypothetical protein F3L18_17655 [Aeromonas hydrophila]|nr:hypothetical protein [Aeromonas hydrophila]HAU4856629.1 hypothetical protein [Aeromonas hydrophila]HAU4861162.1 hypothetical protein [Aeromonas hydrophila]HAU4865691.1 hypothetical protein [Aeromonas hydrophila]HAU4877969.1 hypothetical protein [Aeromonas hydrophila]